MLTSPCFPYADSLGSLPRTRRETMMVIGISQQRIAASIVPTARPYLKPELAPCFGIAWARSIAA
jgi:hypothetical protein